MEYSFVPVLSEFSVSIILTLSPLEKSKVSDGLKLRAAYALLRRKPSKLLLLLFFISSFYLIIIAKLQNGVKNFSWEKPYDRYAGHQKRN